MSAAEQTRKLRSKWDAHPGQEEIRESEARFRIVACGRRWGKTKLASHEIFEYAYSHPDTQCWWVAPTYRIADTGFDEVKSLIPPVVLANEKRSKPKKLTLANGSSIEFRSTSKEDGLVGEGVHFLVVDEAAMVPERSWKKELRPTLSDTLGKMLAISTPKGRNWFHDYYQRGQSEDPDHADIESWKAPTYDNPHIKDSEVKSAKAELPERIFEQEYLAVFVDDAGGVFRDVKGRVVADYEYSEESGEGPYHIGVDFARHQDWTVMVVVDSQGMLVDFERMRSVSWPQIQVRIEQLADEYPGEVLVDGSRDNKIVSDLEEAGVPVEPVNFSSTMKTRLIENLAATIEKELITIPDIPQLITELQVFEYDTTRAGNVRYHAPEGFHDDCVDALALAADSFGGFGRQRVRRRNPTGGSVKSVTPAGAGGSASARSLPEWASAETVETLTPDDLDTAR